MPFIGKTSVRAEFQAYPFSLGVASGEPSTNGFVIWTRLAPNPLAEDGNGGIEKKDQLTKVKWEAATDEAMKRIVRSGFAMADREHASSVHVEVNGLNDARPYFYRFLVGKTASPVGCARILSAVGADLRQLRFAVAGCQNYETGYYAAWEAIAKEHFDFVSHYGDYIYEHEGEGKKPSHDTPRSRPWGKCMLLEHYRNRYAAYKMDGKLQAAHASCMFLSSFDDHEVSND